MLKRGGLFIIITILLNLFPIAICQEEEKIPWEVIKADTLMTKAQMQNKPELYDEAEDILKEYIKENPYCVWAYMQLAKGYEEQNKIDLAKKTYEKTLDLEPQDPLIYSEIVHFYFKHDYLDEAESLTEECILKFPDKALRFKESLLAVYIRKNKFDKAEELIESDEELAKTDIAEGFKRLEEITGFLPGSKKFKLWNSAGEKIDIIQQKISEDPEKYSYLHKIVYPYLILDYENKTMEELKEINDRLQKIIDEIE